jgi:hypothetical protein
MELPFPPQRQRTRELFERLNPTPRRQVKQKLGFEMAACQWIGKKSYLPHRETRLTS